MVMNAFDTNFDAENEIYAVNTVANAYMHDPIRVTVGRPVRIYLINVTEFDLINSLHLHGDVLRRLSHRHVAGAERAIAATASAPSRSTSCAVSAPGPEPTSTAR